MDMKRGELLKRYTTMRLGGAAQFLVVASTPAEVARTYEHARKHNLPVFVLGGGSNVIAHDDGFDGIILLNQIKGFEILDDGGESVVIKIGAGEHWDEVVGRAVEMGLSGIEAMSAIPGTAGAAPVQNVGAYGQEIADTFVSLEAYDSQTDAHVSLQKEDCHFSYRHSIFRAEAWGRYCITSITIRLARRPPQPPFYAGVQRYFDEHQIINYTPQAVRDAVSAIRAAKLPDPRTVANTGSFFKNVLVDASTFDALAKKYPDMPFYEMPDGHYKLATGWLIEQAGLKGQLLHGMRVYDKNALVLVNESADSYENLARAREEIIRIVGEKFGVNIEQEPLEIE